MKKALALILGMSMVLSLAGCKDSDKDGTRTTRETTKKPKVTTEETDETDDTDEPDETTKKTKATTSETTEEPTTEETTEETTTESTEASTQDTSKAPTKNLTTPTPSDPSESSNTQGGGTALPEKSAFVVDTKLEYLDCEIFPIYSTYGATDPNGERGYPNFVRCYLDAFDLGADGYDALFDALDGAINPLQNQVMDKYDAAREAFIKQEEADISKLTNSSFSFFLFPCRNDSQIVSMIGCIGSGDDGEDYYESFNFYSQTGEKIEFSDVVKDPKALAAYIGEYLDADDPLLKQIESGEVPFGLTYNNFIITTDEYDIIIGVADHQDVFDLRFFGSAPERFNLIPDNATDVITWDFDENGTLDTVQVMYDFNNYDQITDVVLTYNGKTFHAPDNSDFEGYAYDDARIFYDGENYYLYAMYNFEDVSTTAVVYKITANGLVFVADEEPADFTESYCIDPANFTTGSYGGGVVGTVYTRVYYSMMGGDGLSTMLYPYLEGGATLFTTKVDLKGHKIDKSTGEEVEDVTIPANTTLSLYLLSADHLAVYFDVCTKNEDDTFCVKFDLEQADEYVYTFGGKSADDIFYYVSYAG